MSRKPITLKTKLASALLQMLRPDENGKLVPVIPFEDAQRMSDDQIISLFQWHHYPIRHEAGGPDEAWNLEPKLIAEHRKITAEIDVPQIAKIKRIQARETNGPKPPQIQSRGFAARKAQRSASRPIVRRSGAEVQ